MKFTKKKLMELANINEALLGAPAAASEMLNMLAHPDLKHAMESLADLLDDNEFAVVKKLYDDLYKEVKKYE